MRILCARQAPAKSRLVASATIQILCARQAPYLHKSLGNPTENENFIRPPWFHKPLQIKSSLKIIAEAANSLVPQTVAKQDIACTFMLKLRISFFFSQTAAKQL